MSPSPRLMFTSRYTNTFTLTNLYTRRLTASRCARFSNHTALIPCGMKIYRSQVQNQAKALDFAAVYSRLTKITNSRAELDN